MKKVNFTSQPINIVSALVVGLLLISGCQPTQSTTSVVTTPEIPKDKVVLFMGQDSDTIADYQTHVPDDLLEGITLYTQIKHQDPQQTFGGLRVKDNWQAGDVDFSATLKSAPLAALAIGLAFDSCNTVHHGQRIADGEYDESIDYLAQQLKNMAPRPVFLRIGYEFDGPWNCYQQASYKQAFRRIVKKIRDAQADNVITVWHSATWPDPTVAAGRMAEYDHRNPSHLNDWYPGDDVVDWVGISTFYLDLHQWESAPLDTPLAAQQGMVDFARNHGKLLLIAESAPQAYRIGQLDRGFIQYNKRQSVTPEQIWNDWYAPLFNFIYANKDVIKGLAYINTHWESQPLWHCKDGGRAGSPDCPQGYWGDTRVFANEEIKARWLSEIHDSEHWVQGKWW